MACTILGILFALVVFSKLAEPSCLAASSPLINAGKTAIPNITSFGKVYKNHSAAEVAWDSGSGWCVTNESAPYLQIDFNHLVTISAIATLGAEDEGDVFFMPKFTLKFGYESGQWYNYTKEGKTMILFSNKDSKTVMNNTIQETMTRFVKILPQFPENKSIVCLKMELYGCPSALKPKLTLTRQTLNLKNEDTGDVVCNASGQVGMVSNWLKPLNDTMVNKQTESNTTDGIFYQESRKLGFKRPSLIGTFDNTCKLNKEEAAIICRRNYTCEAIYSFDKSITEQKKVDVNFKKDVTIRVTVNNGKLSPIYASAAKKTEIKCVAHAQDEVTIEWASDNIEVWEKSATDSTAPEGHLNFVKTHLLYLKPNSYEVINKLTCRKTNPSLPSEILCDTKFTCKAHYNFNRSISAERSADVYLYMRLPTQPSSPSADCSTNMCRIKWFRPEELGDISPSSLRYQLRIEENSKTIHNVFPQESSFEARFLSPNTKYTAKVKTRVQKITGEVVWESEDITLQFQTKTAPLKEVPKIKNSISTNSSIYIEWEQLVLSPQSGTLAKFDLELVQKRYGGRELYDVYDLVQITRTANVDKSITHYTFDQLKPWSLYSIMIRAVNNHFKSGPNAVLDSQTKESVPLGAPREIKAYEVRSTAIVLRWKEPEFSTHNGRLTHYFINWRDVRHNRVKRAVSVSQRRVSRSQCADLCKEVINGLKPFQMYAFKIAAINGAGVGKYSDLKQIQTAQGAPSAPHSLGYNENKTEFFLIWKQPLQPNGVLKEYEIYMKLKGSVRARFTKDTWFDTKINNTNTLDFRVRAYTAAFHNDGGLVGDWSEWATAKRRIIVTKVLPEPSRQNPVLAIVISFLVIIILLCILIVVLFVLYRRRQGLGNRRKLEIEMDSVADGEDDDDVHIVAEENVPFALQFGSHETVDVPAEDHAHLPVPLDEFHSYINRMQESDSELFLNQYRFELNSGKCYSTEIALRPENKPKNRYINIVAYDHSRVILRPESGKRGGHHRESDYFNANYIEGYCPQSTSKYVACQGPMESVFADFWRMIWQDNCSVVVMLTNLEEGGKIKCDQYWPSHGACKYGNITVRLKSTDQTADYLIRFFEIEKGTGSNKERRPLMQFHFISWPDHNIPEFPTAILSLRRRVRHHYVGDSPMVVHCSAGVGRTGCFVLIDAMLERIDNGEGTVDIFNYLQYMRTRRINMVQTPEQYIFAHTAVLEYITFGDTEISVIDLERKLREMEANDGIAEEFRLIESTTPGLETIDNSNKVLLKNGKYLDIFYIDGYKQRDAFFLCNSPSKSMAPDFWKMLVENDCHTIVMLNLLDEDDNYQYWPDTGTHHRFGSLTVVMTSEQQNGNIATRKFQISSVEAPEEGFEVQHIQFLEWPLDSVPKNRNSVSTLMSMVEKSRQTYGNRPVLVHSGNAASRSGTFIAIYNSTERLKVEQLIDVLQCVRAIRTVVPNAVGNTEQYEFIYEMIRTYLEAFETYSNFTQFER